MNFLQCDVVTYCVGQAASMATLLLASGAKGKRYALPNSRVMMHQPSGGATGQTSDISIAAKEILRWRAQMNRLIAEHTNKSEAEVAQDTDRDFYLNAEDAKAYGVVDQVIVNKISDPTFAHMAKSTRMTFCSFCGKAQNEVKNDRWPRWSTHLRWLCDHLQDDH